MIQSFADKTTAAIFAGLEVRRLPRELQQRAAEKLALLHAAHTVDDLRIPPGNRLEKLSGERVGQWSIRINNQWRICFTRLQTYHDRPRPHSHQWHHRPYRRREDHRA